MFCCLQSVFGSSIKKPSARFPFVRWFYNPKKLLFMFSLCLCVSVVTPAPLLLQPSRQESRLCGWRPELPHGWQSQRFATAAIRCRGREARLRQRRLLRRPYLPPRLGNHRLRCIHCRSGERILARHGLLRPLPSQIRERSFGRILQVNRVEDDGTSAQSPRPRRHSA